MALLASARLRPGPPSSFLTAWGQSLLSRAHFCEYEATIKQDEEEKDRASLQAKQMRHAVLIAKHNLDSGNQAGFNAHFAEATKVAEEIAVDGRAKMEGLGATTPDRMPRLACAMESFVRLSAYKHFLCEGQLLPQSSVGELVSDEEFLGGVICVVQDLRRFAVGRAIKLDVESVTLTRDLTEALLAELLKFHFRNGHLRQSYDGVKHALRHVQTVLFQLSQALPDKPPPPDPQPAGLVRVEDFDGLRERMTAADDKREHVIKRCRDAQRASKQAIFALHRQDTENANAQLGLAEGVLRELLPMVKATPSLRYGSFSCAVEEFVEGRLFQEWLQHRRLLSMTELELANGDEFVGGLCDFTGELGRFAVARATQRDKHTVEQCLDTNVAVQNALLDLGVQDKFSKKMDVLNLGVGRLEGMLFELCLLGRPREDFDQEMAGDQ